MIFKTVKEEQIVIEEEKDKGVSKPIFKSSPGFAIAVQHQSDDIKGLGMIGVFKDAKMASASTSMYDSLPIWTFLCIICCWFIIMKKQ
jgi:hypothetical protein